MLYNINDKYFINNSNNKWTACLRFLAETDVFNRK